jgi:hypothetical protein
MKWMKKGEFNNRQKRWERGGNDMEHRNMKVSVSWQNDTVELSRKEQVVISRLRTGYRYTRATHRHIIEKTNIPDCPFCDVTTDHILWQCSETRNEKAECGIQSTA